MNNIAAIALTVTVSVSHLQSALNFTNTNDYIYDWESEHPYQKIQTESPVIIYPNNMSLTNSPFDFNNSDVNAYNALEVECMSPEIKENLEIINSFFKLKDNWDDFDALAPRADAIQLARKLICRLNIQPEVFPTPDGGVQIEYVGKNKEHLNIEILSKNKVNVFEMISLKDFNKTTISYNIDEINRRIESFYDRIQSQ